GGRGRSLPSPNTIRQLEMVKGQLTDCLRALAVSFGEVGYCQGLDYVVAYLIKCLGTDCHRGFESDPERVFEVIVGLFRDYGLEHIYSENLEALQLMLGVLDFLIETRLPRLHKHFREQDVDVAFFAVGWFQTLFLYNSQMPSDTLLWLWDNWVTERSYKVFFRAAMAILKLSEPTLLQLDLESTMSYLSQFPHGSAWVLQKEKLVPAALSIKITDGILRDAQRKLDLVKKKGATGVGWTRAPQTPPVNDDETTTTGRRSNNTGGGSGSVDSFPDPVNDNACSGGDEDVDDAAAAAAATESPILLSPTESELHRHHVDVHGSDAPPVQAALRSSLGGGGGGGRYGAG
ncbi:unnamed protein product, partial [Scytosiphon promiscuus]